MDGILNVRKPAGPTSHDVVAAVRRIFGEKRVGHTGTLDPMAEGVLVICLGRTTRIVQYLVTCHKVYHAAMALGTATDTQDATGEVIDTRDASGVTRESLLEVLKSFTGTIEQVPPMVSAIKHQGTPLYKLARRGEEVERQPRKVTIDSIDLLSFAAGSSAEAEIVVTCSSGTYIRTLCADVGEKLGCGGHMKSLIRTRVGRFGIEDSVPLDVLAQAPRETLGGYLISPGEALREMPSVQLSEAQTSAVQHGMPVDSELLGLDDEAVRMLSPDGSMVAVGLVCDSDGRRIVKPKTVLAVPDE